MFTHSTVVVYRTHLVYPHTISVCCTIRVKFFGDILCFNIFRTSCYSRVDYFSMKTGAVLLKALLPTEVQFTSAIAVVLTDILIEVNNEMLYQV